MTPPAVDRLEAVEDLERRARGEAGGGLVEDEDRGLDDQRAGDGEHLPLAAGQARRRGGAGRAARSGKMA